MASWKWGLPMRSGLTNTRWCSPACDTVEESPVSMAEGLAGCECRAGATAAVPRAGSIMPHLDVMEHTERLVPGLSRPQHGRSQRGWCTCSLVLHQRDERRHHQRHPTQQECWELVAQRFSHSCTAEWVMVGCPQILGCGGMWPGTSAQLPEERKPVGHA